MDLMGVATYFVAVGPIKQAVIRFSDALSAMWPSVHVSIDPHNVPEGVWSEGVLRVGEIDPNNAEVYFARDEPMIRHFEENSYAPMADGTGVFAIYFGPLRDHERVAPFSIPEGLNDGIRRLSIDTTLVLPHPAFSVMLLAPTHPEDGEFSQMVYDLLLDVLKSECG